jgi:hypothetical protein
MAVTQTVLGLKKQDYQDPSWQTALNSGFDDATTRLTLAGAASPEGVTTGNWVGQRYFDTTNKRWFMFTGTPGANTGWVIDNVHLAGTVANRATSFPLPIAGHQWVQNAEATLRLQQMYLAGAWANVFNYGAGTNAAKPTLDLPTDGLAYFNTDKGHAELRVASAWVDLWPGMKLQKAESTYTGTAYNAAFAYVKETAGAVDLNVPVVIPATGSWMILVLANVVAAGPNNMKAIFQNEIHEDAVFAGTRGGTGFPDTPTFNIAASAFHVKTAPANSTTYTFKMRAASQQNNCQSVAAGIYTALLRVA